MSPQYRGSEQAQSVGRRYGVSARLHGKLNEDAFDVGFHGLGGNLQLLSDAFVGKSIAHRAQDAVFARTQRLRDARGTSASSIRSSMRLRQAGTSRVSGESRALRDSSALSSEPGLEFGFPVAPLPRGP
jgi:hypothetical protein